MPRVNEYKGRDGFYIRASKGRSISTYQVTAEGEKVLRDHGVYGGASITRSELDYLIDSGYAYTHGGGPGTIDVFVPPSREVSRPASSAPRHSGQAAGSSAEGCMTFLFMLLIAIAGACVVSFLGYQVLKILSSWSLDIWVVITAAMTITATFWWLAVALQNE